MEEEDNRWARPVLHDVKWERKDGYPAWLNEDRVQRGLAGKFDRPVLVIVGGDPMLHSVDESDGNPPLAYWRASVYLLQTNLEGIEGTRFSSLCLWGSRRHAGRGTRGSDEPRCELHYEMQPQYQGRPCLLASKPRAVS